MKELFLVWIIARHKKTGSRTDYYTLVKAETISDAMLITKNNFESFMPKDFNLEFHPLKTLE